MFFLWKELITATKRVKKGERWGGRKGEKISRQSIKSYELCTMLWTVRNLGTELAFMKCPNPTAFEEGKANKGVSYLYD